MTDLRFEAKAFDETGFELWSDVVEAPDAVAAEAEAKQEYESYMTSAYEPGHYKAQAMLDAVKRFAVKRLP